MCSHRRPTGKSGSYTFEREVQTHWLPAGPNRFEFALDKSLPPSPADPRELGIIVTGAVTQLIMRP